MTTTPNTNAALWGALLAASGVTLGAFGAHALKSTLSAEALVTFETGVRYQMYAGLGTLALAALPQQTRAPKFLVPGAVVFSGSLYVLTLTGQKWLGAITPIGGALMIAGFVLAAVDAKRRA